MSALPVAITVYVLIIGFIVVARITTKEKSAIADDWPVFVGLMACSTPIFLGFFIFGYFGAFIGLAVTVFILRQIYLSARPHDTE